MSEYLGYGGKLQVDNGGYVDVGQVRDVNGPSMSLDTVEVSHRDSPWKKFIPGLIDGGEVTFDIVYDPDLATHSATAAPGLPYYMLQRQIKLFRLTYPDTSPARAIFSAIVTKFQPKSPYAGTLTAEVTLKITAAIVWE